VALHITGSIFGESVPSVKLRLARIVTILAPPVIGAVRPA
jgi:hypothetical protein